MLINRIIRYILGYVAFSFYGAYPEQFITLINKSGIDIWNTRCRGGIYYSSVRLSQYKALKPIARRCGIRLRATMQAGLPLFFKKYKKRMGMAVGMAIFALILCINTQYIWTIRVVGCEQLSEETVKEAFEQLGLYSGVKSSSIDDRMISERARLMLPDVSWIYVNLQGCLAQIELSERTYAPEIDNDYCNMVAKSDGQILSVETYSGRSQVLPSQGVAKGDLLISGIIEDQYGKTTLTKASGRVMAQTERSYRITVPYEQVEYIETGQQRRLKTLNLLKLKIPLYFSGEPAYDYSEQQTTDSLTLYGTQLPIGISTRLLSQIKENSFSITEQQAIAEATLKYEQLKLSELDGCEILSESTEQIIEEDCAGIFVKIVCKENIAIQQKFIVN